jgi:D-sedoheptulose 7-phosphate isomerase
MKASIKECIQNSIDVKTRILEDDAMVALIEQVANVITNAYQDSKKVVLCGNGGSAADAQHIAGEFVGRFYKERRALPAIVLHGNTSVVTAIANDYGYDAVFTRQVEAHVVLGDVVIGISSSGNSSNVVQAIQKAKEIGAMTVGLTGERESALSQAADFCFRVPSTDTPRIQESHIMIGHIICYLVEQSLFPD